MTNKKSLYVKLRFALVRFFWPKILFPTIRESYRLKSLNISSQYRDLKNRSTPIDPWAFIRIKNEIKTLECSLNSVSKAFNKGIIGYNDCTDGSEEVILDFCAKHPTFNPFKYPHKVIPGSTSIPLEQIPYENTLAAYYNAVLNLIPKGEWLLKIDCDHYYFSEILKASFSLPLNDDDIVIYSRLNLVRKKRDIRVHSYTRPGDQWLIKNNNLSFINIKVPEKDTDQGYTYWEHLVFPEHIRYRWKPECSNFHFPFEKGWRNLPDEEFEKLPTFEEFCRTTNDPSISEELKDKDQLLKIISRFKEP